MARNLRSRGRVWRLGVLVMAVTAGCRGPTSVLDPAGPRASQTLDVWWLMLVLGLTVYAAVMVTLCVSLLRTRGVSERARLTLVVGGGIGLPALILLVLNVANLRTLVAVAAPSQPPALTIDVVAHQWWWEVRYPDQQLSTANEIHIPVGQPVLLHLTSADVIHSFWVPRLAGKTDLNPGATTSTWIQADQAGDYRGQCAEYCGIEHANMALTVFAEPSDAFQAWIQVQQQPAVVPSSAEAAAGAQAFATEGCIACHALRYGGTAAVGGGVGPDLTHVASRSRIAAGTLPNDMPTLERWIANPQALKKGTTMPAAQTDAQTIHAIAVYLSSLT